MKSQITNHKSQTNSKRVWNLEFWSLGFVWNLVLGAWNFPSRGRAKGISLIEAVVYIALLGIFAVFISNFLLQIVNTYYRARAEREVLSNARLLLETVTKFVAQSSEVYAPTSSFNTNLGQLSLITTATSTPEHTTSYRDFWVDNGVFFLRREGGSSMALSAPSVRVTKFRLERIVQGLAREAVKVTLEVASAQSKFPTSATLNSTTALRGNY